LKITNRFLAVFRTSLADQIFELNRFNFIPFSLVNFEFHKYMGSIFGVCGP